MGVGSELILKFKLGDELAIFAPFLGFSLFTDRLFVFPALCARLAEVIFVRVFLGLVVGEFVADTVL